MYGLSVLWQQIIEIIEKYAKSENIDSADLFISYLRDSELVELNENGAIITSPLIYKFVLESNKELIDYGFSTLCHKTIKWRIETNEIYQKNIQDQIEIILNDNISDEYTFDNFVVGPSNVEANTAALQCATNPGNSMYNPLVIYGDSGLGKTHLLYAIGNKIKKDYPNKKILYISCTDMVSDIVHASKEQRLDEYKNSLYDLDVLLVDDIQNLSGKETSNKVFFDIYNKLYNNHKQIVLSSDRPAEAIRDIEQRLVTRFSQGLSVTIQALENETALKILQLKMKTHGIEEKSINPEVLTYIANNFSSSVRELEGALNQLLFFSINFAQQYEINMNIALEALNGKKNRIAKDSPLEIKDIIKAVSSYYGLNEKQLTGNSRTKNVATARHIAMYLCRQKIQDASYIKIGEVFGGKDHSTVLSACEKIENLIKTDKIYQKVISDISSLLK